ncbi:hypothetical protein [Streptomyces klenkii]
MPVAADAGAGDDEMPFAVEAFQYPGGAKIGQEKGITLYKGDGHILFTECANPHDIEIRSRVGQGRFCFAVKGKQGRLALEIADAFGIDTQDHPVQATIRSGGTKTVIDAPTNRYTGFGEADKSGSQAAVLLELRVTS